MSRAAISRAVAARRLHQVFPAVYSVVPPKLMTDEARHAAAILAGGRDAALCGPSLAWWLGLRDEPPEEIHVAVAGARRPVPGIRWHRLKLAAAERDNVDQMPITSPARLALDLANELTKWDLKGLLADLEYHCGVSPDDVRPLLRRGFAGSRKLREALDEHTPQLAQTRGHLERAFAELLVEGGFVLPRFNHPAGTSTVDCAFTEAGVIVELDGVQGHSGDRRLLRDHRRDLHRRAEGRRVLRYHYAQVMSPGDRVLIERDLELAGVSRTA